ncbi:MAG TPA: YraN family protein [Candidatus Saccharimonadales bacterium]|nr:YraN family protein [Candidatus Saccharimonadales bacterium]
MNKTTLGKYGEDIAAKFLAKNGYKIIERNFRIRGGEIDIIAKENQTLVYIEVKTRTSAKFGLPEESVNYYKLKFLERAAKFYRNARQNNKLPAAERIDVVSINLEDSQSPQIKLIQNVTF